MMSPISIAQYLAPGEIEFDVVIFDEASQVEPADAYGAIARGHQLLLVGDEKQLPPTNFFSKLEVEEAPATDDSLNVSDLESVLSLGVVRLHHQCALRWHYRSRHASLIDFSNHQFYDSKLRVFPGPFSDNQEFGLSFHFVEGGVYMRGAGQHNPVEAQAVAAAALRHAVEAPHRSLGIGAFSVAQQRAIENEIERLRRRSTDPRIEAFFAAPTHEPFFVKNLETIQGDERDVILLSVGYGPDQHGKLTMNFGPLNRDSGWRRLNVLVTRARERCVLYSSIRADQINLNATRARGVAALKMYLQIAEQGSSPDAGRTSVDQNKTFGATLERALRARGWDVHANVGTVGSFIDLAVVDPDRPGRYLLGIETDGATYASAPTARDRDRLRQQVLVNLGWTIYRAWSMDLYGRPESTLKHLLGQLEAVRQRRMWAPATGITIKLDPAMLQNTSAANSEAQPMPANQQPVGDTPTTDEIQPYTSSVLRQTSSTVTLGQVSAQALGSVIAELVADESPIHEEEAQRVIAAYYGTRASKNARIAFDQGLRVALRDRRVRQRGAFLWHPDMQKAPVRYHGEESPVTRPELIAPEEFQEAIKLVLTREFGLRQEDLIVSTSRLLGYRRCGTNLETAIRQALQGLLMQGSLEQDGEGFLKLRS